VASDGKPLLIRKALAYAAGLDALTPVILDDELLVVGKSRCQRGAVPYLQYSAKFFRHFLSNVRDASEPDIYGHSGHSLGS
jgi:indoleacetate decarboxylase